MMKEFGFFISSTTTSGGSTTTLVDTGILKYDANRLKDKWVLITSGNNDTEARRISSVSSSTITVTTAFSNTVATSVTYEIMAVDPDHPHDAIGSAIRTSVPPLYVALRDETLVVDDLLSNSLFETFSAGFTGWTAVGSPTVTQETVLHFEGAGAAKVVAGGSAGQLTQQPTISDSDLTGKTVHFARWVAALADSVGRIRITFDGSTYTSSDYVDGSITTATNALNWKKLEVNAAVPDGATQITAVCEAAASGTAYFDGPGGLWVGRKSRYTIPTSFVLGPYYILHQDVLTRPDGEYTRIGPNNPVRSGHKLRLIGIGRLSSLSTDASTVELDSSQSDLLLARALKGLYRRLEGADPGRAQQHRSDMNAWAVEEERLANRASIFKPKLGSQMHDVFHFEEDSSGRYLVLDGAR